MEREAGSEDLFEHLDLNKFEYSWVYVIRANEFFKKKKNWRWIWKGPHSASRSLHSPVFTPAWLSFLNLLHWLNVKETLNVII